ncbi:MAG: hypothetical protein ACE5KQ_02580 [Thermoplasmata archaeon]
MPPEGVPRVTGQERRREVSCSVCIGDWKRCRFATCPKLQGVRQWTREAQRTQGTRLYGATPPAAFVGQWGYPRVLVGPLLPPSDVDVSVMDAEERWLGLPLQEILRLRMSMVRGKRQQRVQVADLRDRPLEALQEVAMASDPVHAEMQLSKRPNLDVYFSPRGKPVGPSAPFESLQLTENPKVPRRVDYIVSDGDLRAGPGTWDLYEHGIEQRHLTRLLSVGLLGRSRNRRLVPTEWSITAVDDIVGQSLRKRVRYHPELGEFHLYGATAVANNVQVLLLPGPWMFEALEGWEGHPAGPASDFECAWGRKDYPRNLVGAYHAARLPVLEHLDTVGRQAIAIVFLEVYREWIPLGVWRFRELAREALRRRVQRFSTFDEALEVLGGRLRIPLERWLQRSTLYGFYRKQRRLEDFMRGPAARSH